MKIHPRRKPPGSMNGHEMRYAALLEFKKSTGDIQDYKFESVKFKLADKTTYTPDFFVITNDSVECHEVKGFLRDDAAVKFKVAAAAFPWFRWVMIRYRNKSVGFETVMEY
jgi:hypothetical protein